MEFIGYHGTSKDIANRIITTNFTINNQHLGSLGKGIYFFEENEELAKEYAMFRHNGKITEVIKSVIIVAEDLILDTADNEAHQWKFHEYRNELKLSLLKRSKMNVHGKNMNALDGAVYESIVKSEGYKLIRSKTFTALHDDRENYVPNSFVPNGVELCLKCNSYVKDKNIV